MISSSSHREHISSVEPYKLLILKYWIICTPCSCSSFCLLHFSMHPQPLESPWREIRLFLPHPSALRKWRKLSRAEAREEKKLRWKIARSFTGVDDSPRATMQIKWSRASGTRRYGGEGESVSRKSSISRAASRKWLFSSLLLPRRKSHGRTPTNFN